MYTYGKNKKCNYIYIFELNTKNRLRNIQINIAYYTKVGESHEKNFCI